MLQKPAYSCLQNVTCNAMTTISKNKLTFYGRLILIIPLVLLFLKPIQNLFHKQADGLQFGLLLFFLVFVTILFLFLFLGLFNRPISLTADSYTGRVTARTILRGSKTVSLNDIRGYSSTLLRTKIKSYQGVLLYLQDDKKIELTEFNLESLDSFREFLNSQKIKCFGNEISWFPFRPVKFRFDGIT